MTVCLRRGGLSYCLCCKYDHFFGISLLRIEDDVFYAHSLSDNPDTSQWQTLPDHLEATAALAERFAAEFGAQNAGRLAGLLHDLGKYSAKFQARLKGSLDAVDHSTAGAAYVASVSTGANNKVMTSLISHCIAGHHAGLADQGDLLSRLRKAIEPIDAIWSSDIEIDVGQLLPASFQFSQQKREIAAFQLSFLGRMIFSCLVDADFKDTERFYNRHSQKRADRDWPELPSHILELVRKFEATMAEKQQNAPQNALNRLRADILAQVQAKAVMPTGLFTLTVPTGGGKTLASLGFALDHAKVHGLRRIIYAIPFTSIIDQTAGVFRSVLGDEYILEHHSSIDDEKFFVREQRDKLRLAMEDWAAPVVVTTNVQLFESLFANRPSRCRKLHNLAKSVIILDEAQTLPHQFLLPCMAVLDELAKNYGCTIVLCTATQPALDKRSFLKGVDGLALEGRELAPDPAKLAHQLKRVEIVRGPETDDDQLVEVLGAHSQALVIVNGRRHALELYKKGKAAGLEGMVHLTTRQFAADRREILAKVRQDLSDEKPCRLIATSLVEAGVDVDFPRVWRAETGLDSIAQAAGRCNREGKRPITESIVTVFKPKDHAPPREIEQLAADFARMADKFPDFLSTEAMTAYFQEVFWRKGADRLDEKKVLGQFSISNMMPSCNYKAVAQDFRFIESGMMPIIIPGSAKVAGVLAALNNAEASPGKAARELQSYIVQVPPKDVASLLKYARVLHHRPDLWGEQFLVLDDLSLYRPEVGLMWENADVLENSIF